MGNDFTKDIKNALGRLQSNGLSSATSKLDGLFGKTASGATDPNGFFKPKSKSGTGNLQPPSKSKKGAMKNQFDSKLEATDILMNTTPLLATEKVDLLSPDWENGYPGFEITHIQNYVRAEFMRREKNFGFSNTLNGELDNKNGLYYLDKSEGKFNIKDNSEEGFFTSEYSNDVYRGTKTAWVKVVSQATTESDETLPNYARRDGFVMHGVDGFKETYGINSESQGITPNVLGFDCNGKEHTLYEKDFKHRPCPGITNIKVEQSGIDTGNRVTTIDFVCWSRSQLDYLQPYFFTAGILVFLEYGWNTFPRNILIDYSKENIGSCGKYVTNVESLSTQHGEKYKYTPHTEPNKISGSVRNIINARRRSEGREPLNFNDIKNVEGLILKRPTGLVGLWEDGHVAHEKLKSGTGNYGYVSGMISNYSYSLRSDGGYDCQIQVTSMAKVAQMMTNNSTKATDKETNDEVDAKSRMANFKEWVDEEFTGVIQNGGTFAVNATSDSFAGGMWATGVSNAYTAGKMEKDNEFVKDLRDTRKQYFKPNQSRRKDYYIPKDETYITTDLFLSIINTFFSSNANDNAVSIAQYELGESRCVAHPNIKSTDGKILLIPNAFAPRYNDDKNLNSSQQSKMEASIRSAEKYFSTPAEKKNFLEVTRNSSFSELASSRRRDNLHAIITQVQKGMPDNSQYKVKPFPDFAKNTNGMSGRIADLYVNLKVIQDAVKNNNTVNSIVEAVFKKISSACNDIWDFKLVPKDSNSPNCTTLVVKDTKFPGYRTVEDVKRDSKAYIFKTHQKNSIVRDMNIDIQIAPEKQSMFLYSDPSDPQSAFFARNKEDRILSKSREVKIIPGIKRSDDEKEKPEKEAEDTKEEYYTAGCVVGGTTSIFWMYDVHLVDYKTERNLRGMTNDNVPQNSVKGFNQPIDGCEMTLTLDGIEGLRMLDAYNCTGIPTYWMMNGIWQINSIDQELADGDWKTIVKGMFRPNSRVDE
jgi:hypothetical protein